MVGKFLKNSRIPERKASYNFCLHERGIILLYILTSIRKYLSTGELLFFFKEFSHII
jgi:hypothetical protein